MGRVSTQHDRRGRPVWISCDECHKQKDPNEFAGQVGKPAICWDCRNPDAHMAKVAIPAAAQVYLDALDEYLSEHRQGAVAGALVAARVRMGKAANWLRAGSPKLELPRGVGWKPPGCKPDRPAAHVCEVCEEPIELRQGPGPQASMHKYCRAVRNRERRREAKRLGDF